MNIVPKDMVPYRCYESSTFKFVYLRRYRKGSSTHICMAISHEMCGAGYIGSFYLGENEKVVQKYKEIFVPSAVRIAMMVEL